MKREIKSVAMATLCCLMIFTSCAKTTRNVNNDEQVVSKELSTKDATGKDIPEWVKGSLGEGTLFEKVDIDGIGGADDEVYIITGRFDDYGSDYRNGLTVVYVHLGTGEVSNLLDTTDYDRPVGGIEWREGISSGSISYGLEIVNIEGLEQQGLQICYLAPQEIAGQKNFKTRTIYWDCGVWRLCQ